MLNDQFMVPYFSLVTVIAGVFNLRSSQAVFYERSKTEKLFLLQKKMYIKVAIKHPTRQ